MTEHPATARIERRDGVRWVLCPACSARMGELAGDRLVVKSRGKPVWIAIVDVDQIVVCPRCYSRTVLAAEAC